MADNVAITAGTGTNVAADEATYSGDTSKVQIVRQVHVDGSEGSKTVKELIRLEDAAHTSGDPGIPALGVRADTAASLAQTDGDYTMPIYDASGRQHVNVGTSALPTGASTAAKQPALGTAGSASSDVITIQGIASGTVVPISVASIPSHAVTNAGTFATQVDGNALTALQLIDDAIFADDAAYTLSTSKGTVVEGVAVETDGTDPSSVSAEGDAAAVRTDRNRRLLVNDNHPNSFTLFENHTSAQTNNQLKAAPGASLSIYITDLIVSNGATAGTAFLVEDEGGTPVQKTQTLYFAINGGAALHFKTPLRLTANKTLGFTSATVTTHSIEVHGYIAP